MKLLLRLFIVLGTLGLVGVVHTTRVSAAARATPCYKCVFSIDGMTASCEWAKSGGAVDCDGNISRTKCSIEGYAACPGDETEFSAAGEPADGLPTTLEPDQAVLTQCGLILQRGYSVEEGAAIKTATRRMTL